MTAPRPRLMATAKAIGRSRKLLQGNATLRDRLAAIIRLAELMRTLPLLTPDTVLDPNESEQSPLPRVRSAETGCAAPLLDIARRFGLRMQTLGIVWLLTDDERLHEIGR